MEADKDRKLLVFFTASAFDCQGRLISRIIAAFNMTWKSDAKYERLGKYECGIGSAECGIFRFGIVDCGRRNQSAERIELGAWRDEGGGCWNAEVGMQNSETRGKKTGRRGDCETEVKTGR